MDPSVSLEDLERVSESRANAGLLLVSYGVLEAVEIEKVDIFAKSHKKMCVL